MLDEVEVQIEVQVQLWVVWSHVLEKVGQAGMSLFEEARAEFCWILCEFLETYIH